MQKILVAEDDNFLSTVVSSELTNAGYEVYTAVDGEQCIVVAREKAPDLILLDILMPNVSGYEALARLKAEPATAQIPVIMLSNLGQPEEIDKAKQAGAADYLIKVHFTPKEIIEKVHTFLGDAKPAAAV